jgi:putative transposase
VKETWQLVELHGSAGQETQRRERYERAEGEASGLSQGYRRGRMKTAEGTVEFLAPQLHDTAEPFVSAVRENLAGRTEALGSMAQ